MGSQAAWSAASSPGRGGGAQAGDSWHLDGLTGIPEQPMTM